MVLATPNLPCSQEDALIGNEDLKQSSLFAADVEGGIGCNICLIGMGPENAGK